MPPSGLSLTRWSNLFHFPVAAQAIQKARDKKLILNVSSSSSAESSSDEESSKSLESSSSDYYEKVGKKKKKVPESSSNESLESSNSENEDNERKKASRKGKLRPGQKAKGSKALPLSTPSDSSGSECSKEKVVIKPKSQTSETSGSDSDEPLSSSSAEPPPKRQKLLPGQIPTGEKFEQSPSDSPDLSSEDGAVKPLVALTKAPEDKRGSKSPSREGQ